MICYYLLYVRIFTCIDEFVEDKSNSILYEQRYNIHVH